MAGNIKQKLKSSEIKQLTEEISTTNLFILAGLADVIKRYIDIRLKDEVSWNKTFALIVLTVNGGSITPGELGRLMLRSKENTTKMVNGLVEEGLVKRYRRGKDRRSVQVRLTDNGYGYMKKIIRDIKNEEKKVISMLNPEDNRTLQNISIKLIKKLRTEISKYD